MSIHLTFWDRYRLYGVNELACLPLTKISASGRSTADSKIKFQKYCGCCNLGLQFRGEKSFEDGCLLKGQGEKRFDTSKLFV